MPLHVVTRGELDVRRIEGVLLAQDGVVDALVWTKNGMILARVTVSDHYGLDETSLRKACESELGSSMTPALIMVERALRPAA